MRTLVVDDEKTICDGIAAIARKALLTEHEVETAYDSVDALELLRSGHFDLLVTDISMPELSGIELARLARTESLVAHIIVVTGFDEFEYAQKAVKARAFDYLLKPIDKAEFVDGLRRAARDIEERGRPAVSDERESLRAVLDGSQRGALLPAACAWLGPEVIIVASRTSDRLAEYPVLISARRNDLVIGIVRSREMPEPLAHAGDEPIGLARWDDGESAPDLQTVITGALCARLAASLVGISQLYYEPSDEATASTMLSGVLLTNETQIISAARDFASRLAANPVATLVALHSVARIAVTVGDRAHFASRLHSIEQRLFPLSTVQGVLDLIRECCGQDSDDTGTKKATIDRVIAGIERTPLTALYLEGVASELGVSPGYLSRLIRNHRGVSFHGYATERRIAEAKRLLVATNLDVNAIATRVGFTTARQLYRQFKERVGATPGEYRRTTSAE